MLIFAVFPFRQIHSDFQCSKISSDPPKEQQYEQDQKDQSESAAGIVSPVPAVRPGGKNANQHKDQDDKQYGSHNFSPFTLLYVHCQLAHIAPADNDPESISTTRWSSGFLRSSHPLHRRRFWLPGLFQLHSWPCHST